jgi:hypothetical protein
MSGLLAAAALATALLSLPFWLPAVVVRLRLWLFTRINGDEGVEIPGAIAAAHFKWLYSQPAADGRSRGAALSDLFWYWLSPGAELHQEHLEPGERYEQVAAATRRMLAVPKAQAEQLAERCTEHALAPLHSSGSWHWLRLRDFAMPVWAEFYYELVFAERCPAQARQLIVDNANDVVTALKCCGLRHMGRRERLTRYLVSRLEQRAVAHELPRDLTREQQALYLQGIFFNTAVVQMSEATAHVLLAVAQHPEVQQKLFAGGDDGRFLDHVIAETLRLYPLFGISHRVTSAPIEVGELALPAGSVLCFNHPEFHRTGYAAPERFCPARWETLAPQRANYVPFGVAANRPCPAQRMALVTLRVAVRCVLRCFSLASSVSHTRSLPSRGPCLLVPRHRECKPWVHASLLAVMRVRDLWEDVSRGVTQLVLGTYMVWEASRLRLCQRHFESQDGGAGPGGSTGRGDGSSGCPVHADR